MSPLHLSFWGFLSLMEMQKDKEEIIWAFILRNPPELAQRWGEGWRHLQEGRRHGGGWRWPGNYWKSFTNHWMMMMMKIIMITMTLIDDGEDMHLTHCSEHTGVAVWLWDWAQKLERQCQFFLKLLSQCQQSFYFWLHVMCIQIIGSGGGSVHFNLGTWQAFLSSSFPIIVVFPNPHPWNPASWFLPLPAFCTHCFSPRHVALEQGPDQLCWGTWHTPEWWWGWWGSWRWWWGKHWWWG